MAPLRSQTEHHPHSQVFTCNFLSPPLYSQLWKHRINNSQLCQQIHDATLSIYQQEANSVRTCGGNDLHSARIKLHSKLNQG